MSKLLREWKRKRLTTYMAEDNVAYLQALSRQTGVPLGRIMDQALEVFLKNIEARKDPITPPIEEEHFKEAVKRIQLAKDQETAGERA